MESRIIIGLGNPGRKYEATRHNLGFLVVQRLAKQFQVALSKNVIYQGILGQKTLGEKILQFFLPLTFVNNSGEAVARLVKKKHFLGEHILVVCDDLNLDFGQLRIKNGGSDGGHHGLESIIGSLGYDHFARLRLGIGRPVSRDDIVDYVLSPFSKGEKQRLDIFIDEAVSCCQAWLLDSVEKVMNQFNKRKKDE